MKGFLFVLRKELLERRLVFPVALTVGLVPWVLPWLLPSQKADDLRLVAAAALALGLQLAVACATGASTLTGDLATGRLGFLFSQPISERAIWAGKLSAALVASVGAGLLTILPSAVPLASSPWSRVFVWSLLLGLPATLLLVFLAAALAIAERARSAWLILDLVVVLATAGAAIGGVRSLHAAGAMGPAVLVLTFIVPAVLLTWLVASRALVRDGRSELDRAHRAFSLRAAIGLGLVALLAGGYSAWAVRIEPDDVIGLDWAVPLHGSSWVLAHGPLQARPSYPAAFLLDTASDRALPLAGWAPSADGDRLAISGDGLTAARLECRGAREPVLYLARLTEGDPAWRELPITWASPPRILALSDHGHRLALWWPDGSGSGGRLAVHDTASGRESLAIRLDPPEVAGIYFREGNQLLVTGRVWSEVGVGSPVLLSLRSVGLEERAVIDERRIPLDHSRYWIDPLGRAVGAGKLVFSTATGALLGSFEAATPKHRVVAPWLLSTGQLGVCYVPHVVYLEYLRRRQTPKPRLSCRFWSEDGSEPRIEADFAAAAGLLRGQPTVESALVSVRDDEGWSTWRVGLRGGEKELVARGLRSLAPPWAPPGAPALSLYLNNDGGLVRLEPSGERTVLLPGNLDPDADLDAWPYAYSLDWLTHRFGEVSSVSRKRIGLRRR